MKYLWALIGVVWALMSIWVGVLFMMQATGVRLSQKGLLLQLPPFLGGLALIILALPLIWNGIRLATARTPPAA
jgi:hypothetical protein